MFESEYWVLENLKKRFPKSEEDKPALRLGDFFCGCGGLTLGALMACVLHGRRLEISVAADIWPEALDVYRSNFGKNCKSVYNEDLLKMVEGPGSIKLSKAGRDFARSVGRLDVIVAGPPCQGHSDLNNSSRRADPRNLLYTIPVAFALHNKTEVLLVENVPSVVHSSDEVVNTAVSALKESGYGVVEFVANVQDFGLPQTRKRHLLIASRIHSEEKIKELLEKIKPRKKNVELWDFIKDIEEEYESAEDLLTRRSKISAENRYRIEYLFNNDIFDLPNELRPPCHRDKSHSYTSMYGRLSMTKPAQTITSGFGSMGQGRFVHPTQQRMITAHEAARIQGFPDYFGFQAAKKVTHLRQMIGNAVPPPVCAVLLSILMPPIKRNATPKQKL